MGIDINYLELLIYFSFSLLSLITFILLVSSYIKDGKKRYSIHSLTRLLVVLTFFTFITGLYNFILRLSQQGFLPISLFYSLSNTSIELIPNLGILVSTILIVHFIMEKRIEEFKKKEDTIVELHKLNHELEKKATELEHSEEILQKKVMELERFSDVAKQREEKMISLIKKVEELENKSIKKKN